MKSSKMMNNRQVARLLREIAAAYEVKDEDVFRIKAYNDAADSIERSSSEVRDLWEEGKLENISGVGKAIASHLEELFKTGKSKHFLRVTRDLPPGMFPLLEVSGIGAKTAYKLAKNLGLNREHDAVGRLKKAIESGKVAKIEGLGQDSAQKIFEGIEEWERLEDRMLLPIAAELAEKVTTYMNKSPGVERIEALGSLRRRSSTVGDVDLAVATDEPHKVIDHFVKFDEWREVVASGKNTARAIHRSGRQVDLKTEPTKQFGSLLQHFTGSKNHNVRLRELALKKGYSLSEHGIKTLKGRSLGIQRSSFKRFKSEENFYRFLGLDWIPPELREDRGEIQSATSGKLPRLIRLEEIKGDLQIHSDIDVETSHDLGQSSLDELLKKAERLSYEYIAITDHNPSTSRHNDQQVIDLIKRRNEKIDKFLYSCGNKVKIRVIKSLEIDILPDGRRAIPDKAMDLLEFALVSVHSNFRGSKRRQTERVLRSLDHPKVKIFGHPTGRKLLSREGIDYDWDRLFDFCRQNHIWLEVNANPQRLDLSDRLIQEAVDHGCLLVINTDSHEASSLDFMRWGVDQARRGWAEKKDVVNTMGYNQLKKLITKSGGGVNRSR